MVFFSSLFFLLLSPAVPEMAVGRKNGGRGKKIAGGGGGGIYLKSPAIVQKERLPGLPPSLLQNLPICEKKKKEGGGRENDGYGKRLHGSPSLFSRRGKMPSLRPAPPQPRSSNYVLNRSTCISTRLLLLLIPYNFLPQNWFFTLLAGVQNGGIIFFVAMHTAAKNNLLKAATQRNITLAKQVSKCRQTVLSCLRRTVSSFSVLF